MPRYYFHIRDRFGHTADDTGVELSCPAQAYDMAIDSIRSIVADDARRGVLSLGGHVDIGDEHGHLLRVPYGQAFAASHEVWPGSIEADNDNGADGALSAEPRSLRPRKAATRSRSVRRIGRNRCPGSGVSTGKSPKSEQKMSQLPRRRADQIVAIGLLTAEELRNVGTGLHRIYPITNDASFDDLIAAIARKAQPRRGA